MTDNQKKLMNILREMFQFDQSDLDFGIYRIMRMKRDEVNRFIEEELPAQITAGLSELARLDTAADITAIDKQIADTKAAPLSDAIKAAAVAELEEKKKSLAGSVDISAVEADVYNHLTNFFSRYYDEGDFISQRRYKDGVYAIPYEGEEVKLYWANADQYYVKTSEYFKDYEFKTATGETIHFKLVEAETDKDNNKAKDKRFFQLHRENPFEAAGRELFIYMEYKAGDRKQADYTADIVKAFSAVGTQYPDFARILGIRDGKTELERQLTRYTARNTFDYFIHKDLKKFLDRELDFYIKNDVMFLDDIEEQDEAKAKEYLTKAKVIRKIARKIIDFLTQIEDFEKKLYLKKKFVVETNYCITLDRIPEKFYPEIAENDAQRKEWVRLFAIDEIEQNLTTVGYSEPLTMEFLKENPYLVLDTAFFGAAFKEKLIDGTDGLDENLDGLMIHSENFQALNLLRLKYHEKIDCCYIDPPYNTDASKILYKNNYEHSSWLALMNDRIKAGKSLLKYDGIQATAIDEYELKELYSLLQSIFGRKNNAGIIAIRSNPSGRPRDGGLALAHDYCLIFKMSEASMIGQQKRTGKQAERYNRADGRGAFEQRNFRREGSNSNRADGKRQWYPIYVDKQTLKLRVPDMTWNESTELWEIKEPALQNEAIVYPVTDDGVEKNWRWSWDNVKKDYSQFYAKVQKSGIQIYYKFRPESEGSAPLTFWADAKYSAVEQGTKPLKDILPGNNFDYPKSIYTVQDILSISGLNYKTGIIIDYFAGSGTTAHAVINLNRADGGRRKYILVEMGEYFDTVTRPRVEKVIYSEDWKDGKPVSRKGSSHAFKYLRLESYEDTLNNIVLRSGNYDLLGTAREGYMLSYMLDTEAEGSDSLLNVEKLDKPFSYKMNITRHLESAERTIDLVETFNYLIGLTIEKSHALVSFDADFATGEYGAVSAALKEGNTYKFKAVEGTVPSGDKTLVLWREMTGDIVKDNAALDAYFLSFPNGRSFKRIYVNCDNNLLNLRGNGESWQVILIDEEMKKRMFEDAD
ncbi:site-specific DNA-methyltransferase [Caproiciproducens sp. CPB-2]|uniref:site-specific DNA-methyltransferase n=1 Tax=Caproiciproducens sp. CPB-2 TaxID=3030017 RepID=UPI0023DAF9C7|nr:DNA methyltransferase [Caproiciproducens sp. CPB-2]MDF1495806.1 DNA methyltransferase [Caproiciproducens sp. CPB-2]